MSNNTNSIGRDTLDELETLALAADLGEGQHVYTNPRDSNNWKANDEWHRAASPEVFLALIDLARRASATPSSKDAGGEHRIRSWGGNEITLESLLESLHTYSRIMPGAEGRAKWAMREAAAYIEATRATPVHPAAAPSDPMDWPLPCDVKVGGVNIRQGCKLRTLVARMESLHRMAVKAIPEPTPEAREQGDGLSGTYQWLTRSARAGFPEVREAALTMMAYYQGAEFPEATVAGAGRAQTDFEPFTLAELDEIETAARAAPAIWYGTYQIIDGISDEKAVELIEACSPDSIITLVRQARAALARAPLPAQGENVDAANAGELDLDDLDNTAKEALRDLSHVENHLEQSDAPTKVKNRAVDVRLCIKELRAALNDRAGAQDGQAVDDARDAARYRWLRENCYDYEPAGEGDAFDHPSLHFESSELDPYDSASLNWAVDAAMSASRPDDKGEHHG